MGVCADSREADCETYLPPKTPERKSLWLELEHLWFFGAMTRQDATDLLQGETEAGIFLVRNSSSLHGDLVLSVKEFPRVSHYIIHKVLVNDQTLFKIGEHVFSDMPALLQFYKNHYVDTTPLLRPVAKQVEKVRARYNFNGSGDAEDLPFKKGDVLTIVSKDEELWWTARNFVGDTGLIPVNYVEKFEPELYSTVSKPRAEPRPPTKKVLNRNSATELPHVIGSMSDGPGSERNEENRGMIVKVRVKQARVPNAYDKSALRLNIGDVISVVARHDNGQWEGHLRGRVGFFPVTHVEFLEVSCRDVEV